MKIATLIVCIAVVIRAIPNDGSITADMDEEWRLFKVNYDKSYTAEDELMRRQIWEDNKRYINEHNSRYNLGEFTYFLGVNQFSDLTHKEFVKTHLNCWSPTRPIHTEVSKTLEEPEDLPATVDWRKEGYVTPVEYQGSCGSCYAFGALGSIEGQLFRNTRILVSLSEQQIVDCSTDYGNHGCHGGHDKNVFRYVMDFGVENSTVYPYMNEEQDCRYKKNRVVTKIKGFQGVESGNENDLAQTVAEVGPITVRMDARHKSFHHYHGGFYNPPDCSKTNLHHSVLVVGYGGDDDNKYWLVKNSWGTKWGDEGYFMIAKDRDNKCGIATDASYPIM